MLHCTSHQAVAMRICRIILGRERTKAYIRRFISGIERFESSFTLSRQFLPMIRIIFIDQHWLLHSEVIASFSSLHDN